MPKGRDREPEPNRTGGRVGPERVEILVSADDQEIDGIDSIRVDRAAVHEELGPRLHCRIAGIWLVDHGNRPDAIAWAGERQPITFLAGARQRHGSGDQKHPRPAPEPTRTPGFPPYRHRQKIVGWAVKLQADYAPLNPGFRFSRKALVPSRMSAVAESRPK